MQRKGGAQETQNVQPLVLPPMVRETNPPLAGLTNAETDPRGPAAQQGGQLIQPQQDSLMQGLSHKGQGHNKELQVSHRLDRRAWLTHHPSEGITLPPPMSTQVLHRLSLA